MTRYCGKLGFAEQVETRPGIWEEQIVERTYFGDVLSVGRRLQDSSAVNATPMISNRLSIVADAYVNNHIFNLRYVNFQGVNWKVSDVQIEHPRLILTLGDIYNEESA